MRLATTLAIAMAGTTTMSVAQTERDLDSHEHGAALLNIAVDDGAVFLELETPWNNLVGFEHEPSTDEQKAKVAAAMEQLRQPDQLFSFNGGSCAWNKVTIESTMQHDEHHDDHHDDKHDDGEHHDDHHDDKHDDHADHDDHDHDEDTHSSALVAYEYNCEDAGALQSIAVNLFDVWAGFEELDVQLIGPGGQSAVELTAGQTTVELSDVQ